MPRVMFRCPVTERLVPTGYESDGDPGFRRLLPHSTTVSCGACGRTHAWHREEVMLEGSERRERRGIGG